MIKLIFFLYQFSRSPYPKTKYVKERTPNQRFEGGKALSTSTFQANFNIPSSVPPSINQFCSIIRVSYFLKIEALIDFWNGGNLSCKMPIILSSPLLYNLQQPVQNMTIMQPPMQNNQMIHPENLNNFIESRVPVQDLRKL